MRTPRDRDLFVVPGFIGTWLPALGRGPTAEQHRTPEATIAVEPGVHG
jgi:hypothetical protein